MCELQGSWSHYTSTDLLRWTRLDDHSNFTSLTGSVSPTPGGVFAFYPNEEQSAINIAVAGKHPVAIHVCVGSTTRARRMQGGCNAAHKLNLSSKVPAPTPAPTPAPFCVPLGGW